MPAGILIAVMYHPEPERPVVENGPFLPPIVMHGVEHATESLVTDYPAG